MAWGATVYVGSLYEMYKTLAGGVGLIDDFADGSADGWRPTGGTWTVENEEYFGQSTESQFSVWHLSLTSGRFGAKVKTKTWSGHWRNGYLVFDYVNADNFKYAEMREGANDWAIGECVDGACARLATHAETGGINTGQWYDLEIVIAGDAVTLEVDGSEKVSHTFSSGIQGGLVGLRVDNAHTHFDDVRAEEVVSQRKYYYFNGQRIAMNRDGMLQYTAGDHLGTTSVVLEVQNDQVVNVAESRH